MVDTGIKVCDEFSAKFKELKTDHTLGYIVLYIKNKKTVEVEECGEPFKRSNSEEDVKVNKDAFIKLMGRITATDDPKYILFDFHVQKASGGFRDKVILINWCPDTCPISKKMIQSGTFETLKKKADGYAFGITANSKEEVEYAEVEARAKEKF